MTAETSARTGRSVAARRAAATRHLRRVLMLPPGLLDVAVERVHLRESPLEERPQVAQPAEGDLLARPVPLAARDLPSSVGVQEKDVVVRLLGVRRHGIGLREELGCRVLLAAEQVCLREPRESASGGPAVALLARDRERLADQGGPVLEPPHLGEAAPEVRHHRGAHVVVADEALEDRQRLAVLLGPALEVTLVLVDVPEAVQERSLRQEVALCRGELEALAGQHRREVEVAELAVDLAQLEQGPEARERTELVPELQDLAELVLRHPELAERLEARGHAPPSLRHPLDSADVLRGLFLGDLERALVGHEGAPVLASRVERGALAQQRVVVALRGPEGLVLLEVEDVREALHGYVEDAGERAELVEGGKRLALLETAQLRVVEGL